MRMDMPHLNPGAEAKLKIRAHVTDIILEERPDGVAIFGMCVINPPTLRFLGWGPNFQDAFSDAIVRKYRPQQLTEGAAPPVIAGARPVEIQQPDSVFDPRDAELDALRARIAELEAAPVLELSNEPPAEALMEAYPDEDHAALKARILAEFASLRNALVGHIPMTMEQLARLQALEHPKFQTWLQA